VNKFVDLKERTERKHSCLFQLDAKVHGEVLAIRDACFSL